MGVLLSRVAGHRRDERGFTMQEMVVTVAILGILLAIAVTILLGTIERWRVEAATN